MYNVFNDTLWTISNNNITYNLGNLGIGTTTTSTNATNGALTVSGGVGIGGNLNIGGNMTLVGDLTINGTTTTVNSNSVSVNDPIITLAGNTFVADTKDRGIDFRWFNTGIGTKTGFMGYKTSTDRFVFYSDASSNNETYTGTSSGLEGKNFVINSTDTSGNPGFTWSGNTNTGIFKPLNNTIGFTTAGIERIEIS